MAPFLSEIISHWTLDKPYTNTFNEYLDICNPLEMNLQVSDLTKNLRIFTYLMKSLALLSIMKFLRENRKTLIERFENYMIRKSLKFCLSSRIS